MNTVSTPVDPEKVFAAYETRLRRRKVSDAALREFRLTTSAFMAWLRDQDLDMEEVRRTHIEDFMSAAGWAPSTQKARLTYLRKPWAYAVHDLEVLERSPFDGMPVELERPAVLEPRILSIEELRQIRDGIKGGSDWALFHTLAYTGARMAEIRGLKWTDVSYKEQTVYIWGKGSRERTIPLHPELAVALKAIPTFDRGLPYVFPGQRQPMMTHGGMWAKIKAMTRPLDVSAHDFRRTFASSLHDNGADEPAIRRILGHSAHSDAHAAYHRVSQKYLYRAILKVYADDPL